MQSNIRKFIELRKALGTSGALMHSYVFLRTKLGLQPKAIAFVRNSDSRRVFKQANNDVTTPLPPLTLMRSIGAVGAQEFLNIGHAWALLLDKYIMPQSTVLDIGCGCGRIARHLVTRQIKSYSGFDVINENVNWCTNFISKTASHFNFSYFDVYSDEYNPKGKLKCSEIIFPAEAGSIDLAFAASVFTHLFESDAKHYLRELSRTLKPRTGIAVISIHCDQANGKRFLGNEARIDVPVDYFEEIANECGLSISENLGVQLGQTILILNRS